MCTTVVPWHNVNCAGVQWLELSWLSYFKLCQLPKVDNDHNGRVPCTGEVVVKVFLFFTFFSFRLCLQLRVYTCFRSSTRAMHYLHCQHCVICHSGPLEYITPYMHENFRFFFKKTFFTRECSQARMSCKQYVCQFSASTVQI